MSSFCFSVPYRFVNSLSLHVPPRDGSPLVLHISLSQVCTHGFVFSVPLLLNAFKYVTRGPLAFWMKIGFGLFITEFKSWSMEL